MYNLFFRHYLQGVDMTICDYDGRTALHLAAAEGRMHAVKFLLETCRVPPSPQDRWGHTPQEEAFRFGHDEVGRFFDNYLIWAGNFRMVDIEINAWSSLFSRLAWSCTCILKSVQNSTNKGGVSKAGKFEILRAI